MTHAKQTAYSNRSIEARKQNWRALLTRGQRTKNRFCFIVAYNDPAATEPVPAPLFWPGHAAARIERKYQDYRQALERSIWLDDDAIPCLNMITGTEIFAEAFGCPVHRPDPGAPFAMPMIHAAGEVAKIKVPDLGSSTLAYLFDMADELKRRAGSDAILGMVDVQSPMDIAALIWEKASFFVGMIETPEAVKELAGKARQLLAAFLDEWFRRYGTEFIAHWPAYLMTDGLTLSEDEVGAVNADMFEEFFLPELAALSKRYGGIGMHCCADAKHQWNHFRRIPGLRLLNLFNPPTRPPESYIKEAYPFFRDTCAQWHMGWLPSGNPETWPRQYPEGARVVINVAANSKEDAIRLCAKLQEVRQRLDAE
ncbi:MAG: hypothetical protein KJ964_03455 [Verrucomicrobia bacterium]|nr:hypothetical protein [Verrucomicrobiota bacterium]MBU1736448.1 hypothetical protein [Verrucomicrobiota bacterium]MBU1857215.1 hypothetical protein [Verrucomicrobiota bacterium]